MLGRDPTPCHAVVGRCCRGTQNLLAPLLLQGHPYSAGPLGVGHNCRDTQILLALQLIQKYPANVTVLRLQNAAALAPYFTGQVRDGRGGQ